MKFMEIFLNKNINTIIIEKENKFLRKVIKTFESMKVAAESLGIHKEQISAVCRKQRKTAGGYNWRYAL